LSYDIYGQIYISNFTASEVFTITIYKNGSPYKSVFYNMHASNTAGVFSIYLPDEELATGDVISLYGTSTSDSSYSFNATLERTFLSVRANNDLTVFGSYNQSGSYTPTITNGSNVAASVLGAATYIAIGQIVYVSVGMTIDPTSASGTSTDVTISLPIEPTSNFSSAYEAIGTGATNAGTVTQAGRVQANTGAKTASYVFQAQDAANRTHGITFSYKLR
jgi:hypothetical protein